MTAEVGAFQATRLSLESVAIGGPLEMSVWRSACLAMTKDSMLVLIRNGRVASPLEVSV